jgi:hypothetical protein
LFQSSPLAFGLIARACEQALETTKRGHQFFDRASFAAAIAPNESFLNRQERSL